VRSNQKNSASLHIKLFCVEINNKLEYEVVRVPGDGCCFYTCVTLFQNETLLEDRIRRQDKENVDTKLLKRIKKVNVAGKNNNVNFTQLNESVEYSNAEKSAIIRLKFSLLAYYLSNKTGADPNLAEDVELTSSNKPILTNTELMNKFMNWGTFAPEVMYSIAAKLTGRKVEIFKYCEHKQIDQSEICREDLGRFRKNKEE